MITFFTYIAGANKNDGRDIIESIPPGMPLDLVREPMNPYDTNAIAIYYHSIKLGYIPAIDTRRLVKPLDEGQLVHCTFWDVWKEKRQIRTSIRVFEDGAPDISFNSKHGISSYIPPQQKETEPIIHQESKTGCLSTVVIILLLLSGLLYFPGFF